jgi:hypothetical protein
MSHLKQIDYSNNTEAPVRSSIQKIKTEIRSWYGSLSVKELVYNKGLVAEIEKLERLLAGKAVIG